MTFPGWINLIMNGGFMACLFYFLEKLDDPVYFEKVFKKTIWNKKKDGNSKKS